MPSFLDIVTSKRWQDLEHMGVEKSTEPIANGNANGD